MPGSMCNLQISETSMKYADSLNVVCRNIRRIPELIGYLRSAGLHILHQDSIFHLGFQRFVLDSNWCQAPQFGDLHFKVLQ